MIRRPRPGVRPAPLAWRSDIRLTHGAYRLGSGWACRAKPGEWRRRCSPQPGAASSLADFSLSPFRTTCHRVRGRGAECARNFERGKSRCLRGRWLSWTNEHRDRGKERSPQSSKIPMKMKIRMAIWSHTQPTRPDLRITSRARFCLAVRGGAGTSKTAP